MSAHVYGIGARGPLGMNALQLAMCARAGKLCPSTTAWLDKRGQRIGMCITGAVDETVHGYDRLLALAAPALAEAIAQATARLGEVGQRMDPAPLFLALPEAARPDDDRRLDHAVLGDVAAAARAPIDVGRSQVVRAGQAGGVLALEAALAAGLPWAVVGGVDSYYHPAVLRWLDDECRLHALGAENGFIPGEGAAFFVLGSRSWRDAALATVTAAQGALETTVTRDEPNIAAAMTALAHRLLPQAKTPPAWVLSDVNGERHRVREWAMVAMRTDLTQVPEQRLPDMLGDVGAASAATAVAIAASFWQARCAPGSSAVVAMHSEAAERGIALVEVPS